MVQAASSTVARALLVLMLLLAAGPAGAQSYVRADCRPLIGAAPAGQDALTAGWYRRFWTGDCGALRGCAGGAPNWNQIVGRLTARAAPAQRPAVLARACRLGPLIGREWTRPRAVRRIDSGDLRGFKATLDRAGDVLAGLGKVEAQVRGKVGG